MLEAKKVRSFNVYRIVLRNKTLMLWSMFVHPTVRKFCSFAFKIPKVV